MKNNQKMPRLMPSVRPKLGIVYGIGWEYGYDIGIGAELYFSKAETHFFLILF